MLYLGIDVEENNHVASLIDEKGKTIFKDLEVGMETTGHYWLSVYSFLVERKSGIHKVCNSCCKSY